VRVYAEIAVSFLLLLLLFSVVNDSMESGSMNWTLWNLYEMELQTLWVEVDGKADPPLYRA
jgi:hypothetical protein